MASEQDADRPSRSEDAKPEHKHGKDKRMRQERCGCFHPADVHLFAFQAAYWAPERETWVEARCKYSFSARSPDVESLGCQQNIYLRPWPFLAFSSSKHQRVISKWRLGSECNLCGGFKPGWGYLADICQHWGASQQPLKKKTRMALLINPLRLRCASPWKYINNDFYRLYIPFHTARTFL